MLSLHILLLLLLLHTPYTSPLINTTGSRAKTKKPVHEQLAGPSFFLHELRFPDEAGIHRVIDTVPG